MIKYLKVWSINSTKRMIIYKSCTKAFKTLIISSLCYKSKYKGHFYNTPSADWLTNFTPPSLCHNFVTRPSSSISDSSPQLAIVCLSLPRARVGDTLSGHRRYVEREEQMCTFHDSFVPNCVRKGDSFRRQKSSQNIFSCSPQLFTNESSDHLHI